MLTGSQWKCDGCIRYCCYCIMIMFSKCISYHVHNRSLAYWHANVYLLALNPKYSWDWWEFHYFCRYLVIIQSIGQSKTLSLPNVMIIIQRYLFKTHDTYITISRATSLQMLYTACFKKVTSVCEYVCLFSYLADISYSWSQLIPQSLHRCYRGFTEVRGLSIHHLHHHDTHWPNIHLVHQYRDKLGNRSSTLGIHTARDKSPLLFSVSGFECVPPHLSAIWWFGDDLRSHPIGCPH